MGQDIHTHAFLKFKPENRYVDVRELFSEYGFGDLVGDRNYDLFSLFGSYRSGYPRLEGLNFEIPEEAPTLFRAKMNNDPDYHTHSWMYLSDLKRSLEDYLSCMKNPSSFIVRNPDMDEDEKNLIISMFHEKDEDLEYLEASVKNILDRIDDAYVNYSYLPENVRDMVDFDRTIVCFWFDN